MDVFGPTVNSESGTLLSCLPSPSCFRQPSLSRFVDRGGNTAVMPPRGRCDRQHKKKTNVTQQRKQTKRENRKEQAPPRVHAIALSDLLTSIIISLCRSLWPQSLYPRGEKSARDTRFAGCRWVETKLLDVKSAHTKPKNRLATHQHKQDLFLNTCF